jgi:hypothetical protein
MLCAELTVHSLAATQATFCCRLPMALNSSTGVGHLTSAAAATDRFTSATATALFCGAALALIRAT